MRRMRNIKIIATLGPSSSDYATIKQLFEQGADVFRLNMSHGTHADIRKRHQIIRKVECDINHPIGILADLQGPKLRCGVFKNGIEILTTGNYFRFDLNPTAGNNRRVCLPHKEIFQAIQVNTILLVNDGKIRLQVKTYGDDYVNCLILAGGEILNHKGVNIPNVILPLAALTTKDRKDLEFICDLGIDWLALSFVQRLEDIIETRKLVAGRTNIIAKIEKPAALKIFDIILKAADAIMVARGDLGVELPVYDVPPLQKHMVCECRNLGKPVIVATQMLESMINAPVPTRAEVSDVATAIYEGADAIMLSAESALGDFPIEAVRTMNSVAISVESDPVYRQIIDAGRTASKTTVPAAIAAAAREIVETTPIKAICCFTHSGKTAQIAAREKPIVPIIALTPFIKTARKLNLIWGLHCIISEEVDIFKFAVVNARKAAKFYKFASQDDKIVVIAGIPFNTPGSTNVLRVTSVNE